MHVPFSKTTFVTFKVSDTLVFTRVLSAGWVIPLYAQPLPLCALDSATKPNGAELTIEGQPLADVDVCRHEVARETRQQAFELTVGRDLFDSQATTQYFRFQAKSFAASKLATVLRSCDFREGSGARLSHNDTSSPLSQFLGYHLNPNARRHSRHHARSRGISYCCYS